MDELQTKNENQMLWLFVTAVSQGKCHCGYPPNVNGTPCDTCMAIQLLRDRHLISKSSERAYTGGFCETCHTSDPKSHFSWCPNK